MSDTDSTPEKIAPPFDRMTTLSKPTSPVAVREHLIDLMRRDLVGPYPDLDPDLAREVLSGSNPSNWYLTGYLGPRRTTGAARRLAAVTGSEAAQEEVAEDLLEAQRGSEGMEDGATGKGTAPDDASAERPPRPVVRTLLARPYRAAAARCARIAGARHLGRLRDRAAPR